MTKKTYSYWIAMDYSTHFVSFLSTKVEKQIILDMEKQSTLKHPVMSMQLSHNGMQAQCWIVSTLFIF